MAIDTKDLLGQKIINLGTQLILNSDSRSDKETRLKLGAILAALGKIVLEMQKADYDLSHDDYIRFLDEWLEEGEIVIPPAVVESIEKATKAIPLEKTQITNVQTLRLAFDLTRIQVLITEASHKTEQAVYLINELESRHGLNKINNEANIT